MVCFRGHQNLALARWIIAVLCLVAPSLAMAGEDQVFRTLDTSSITLLPCFPANHTFPNLIGPDGGLVPSLRVPILAIDQAYDVAPGKLAAEVAEPKFKPDAIQISEMSAAGATHYKLEILDANQQAWVRAHGAITNTGRAFGEASMAGWSLGGYVMTTDKFQLAHNLNYELIDFLLPGGAHFKWLAHQNSRLGDTSWGFGFSIGGGTGAGLEIPTSNGNFFHLRLSGGPAVNHIPGRSHFGGTGDISGEVYW
jgi:hypothetical protein